MSEVRKHMYMEPYPFVCTQAGTRQMTKAEEKEMVIQQTITLLEAQTLLKEEKKPVSTLIEIVDSTKLVDPEEKLFNAFVSGLCIVTGLATGLAIGLSYLF